MEVLVGTSRLRMPEYRGGRGSWPAPPEPARGGRPGRSALGRSSLGCFAGGLRSEPEDGAAEVLEPVCTASCTSLHAGLAEGGGLAAGAWSRGDHIRVAVRVRPLPPSEDGIIEVAGTGAIAIRKDAATGGNEFLRSQQGRVEERTFDHVFGPEATQREVYAWSCAPLVTEAVAKGRNATIFVYGATGAGKTYTMFGGCENNQHGLIFRAIPEVFHAIRVRASAGGGIGSSDGDAEAEGSLQVKVSFLEIYNEAVRDLLQEGGGGGQCRVLEDERRGVVKVANLVEAPVQSPEEALAYLYSGMQARTVEATAANSQSSRAHAVFTLTVEQVRPRAQLRGPFARRSGEARQLLSRISLIDLAGSERAALTQNSGAALKDGARINQSLLALANCIDALTVRGGGVTTPRKKPPYRDSKLTLMLKGSLTGDGLVAMIANVHPGRNHFEDSNNTLEYARRASTVRATVARRLSRSYGLLAPQPGEAGNGVRCGGGCNLDGTAGYLHHAGLEGDGDCGDETPEDESATATSSSSSRPPPRQATHHRRRREPSAGEADGCEELGASCCADAPPSTCGRNSRTRGGAVPPSERPTTASSPEECLSELSLSSHAGAESCDGQEEGGGCGAASVEVPLVVATPGREDEDPLTVANALIAKLLAEKLQLDTRVRTVVQERNALLQDRDALEEDNDRLRTSNLEKDEQLALLLARCEST